MHSYKLTLTYIGIDSSTIWSTAFENVSNIRSKLATSMLPSRRKALLKTSLSSLKVTWVYCILDCFLDKVLVYLSTYSAKARNKPKTQYERAFQEDVCVAFFVLRFISEIDINELSYANFHLDQ